MNKYKKSRRKASEILIFADQSKQTTGGAYTKNWDNETGKADKYCALGLLGCQTKNMDIDGALWLPRNDFLSDVFGIKKEQSISCELCVYNPAKLENLVAHLNDNHKWSYAQIGNLLKKYE